MLSFRWLSLVVLKLQFKAIIYNYIGYYMPACGYEFYISCSTQYLTSERRSWVRYWVEHEKIKFVSISRHVIFYLLYKHTNDNILTIFWWFLTTFRRFLKIFQNSSEGQMNASEHFPKITKDCEDNRRRSKDVSIIHQQI